jgi:hypothetical protein
MDAMHVLRQDQLNGRVFIAARRQGIIKPEEVA